jgi:hypothetical protein
MSVREQGLPVDDRADVPQLVRDAQQALRLHPSSATPGPDGSEAVKKILGGVSAHARHPRRPRRALAHVALDAVGRIETDASPAGTASPGNVDQTH